MHNTPTLIKQTRRKERESNNTTKDFLKVLRRKSRRKPWRIWASLSFSSSPSSFSMPMYLKQSSHAMWLMGRRRLVWSLDWARCQSHQQHAAVGCNRLQKWQWRSPLGRPFAGAWSRVWRTTRGCKTNTWARSLVLARSILASRYPWTWTATRKYPLFSQSFFIRVFCL